MKQAILSFFTMMFIMNAYAQDSTLPRIDGDTLITTSGFKVAEGQELKIGTGAMPDGDFKFIRKNSASLWQYYSTTGYQGLANQANALQRSKSGLTYKVNRIEKRGKKKTGFVYYVVIATGAGKYEIDIDNAISSGELVVPDEFKPKPKNAVTVVEVKQQISVADELTKLKKLLDDGVLTKEEYDAQKKKLLENN